MQSFLFSLSTLQRWFMFHQDGRKISWLYSKRNIIISRLKIIICTTYYAEYSDHLDQLLETFDDMA